MRLDSTQPTSLWKPDMMNKSGIHYFANLLISDAWFFVPTRDLSCCLLELKASVLPISYSDPLWQYFLKQCHKSNSDKCLVQQCQNVFYGYFSYLLLTLPSKGNLILTSPSPKLVLTNKWKRNFRNIKFRISPKVCRLILHSEKFNGLQYFLVTEQFDHRYLIEVDCQFKSS